MHLSPSKSTTNWVIAILTELCYYNVVLLIMTSITHWLANIIFVILSNPHLSIIKTICKHSLPKNSLFWCIWYINICRLNPKKRVCQCKKLIISSMKFILYSLYITKNDLKFIYKAAIYIITTYLYNNIDQNAFYFYFTLYEVPIAIEQIFIQNNSTIQIPYNKHCLVTLILHILFHIWFKYALTGPIYCFGAPIATILACG